MCSLCQILIRFFLVYVFLVQSTSFSKKSPTLADYLFSLHFFESVIVGQILTLCWNPQLPVKFPFSLLHLHFLFVTTNKNTIFRGKSPYFWWLPRRNHHFSSLCLVNPNVLPVKYPSFSGENKPCLGGGAGVALRGDLVGKNLPNGFMV